MSQKAPKKAREEHASLAEEIRAHDRRYYQDDAPSVSDAEYDRLRHRLQELEAEYPDLVTPESPTQTVGAAPASGFAKVTHARPMLSLGMRSRKRMSPTSSSASAAFSAWMRRRRSRSTRSRRSTVSRPPSATRTASW